MHSRMILTASSRDRAAACSSVSAWRRMMGWARAAPKPVASEGDVYVVPRRSAEARKGAPSPSRPATSRWFHSGSNLLRRAYSSLDRYLCSDAACSVALLLLSGLGVGLIDAELRQVPVQVLHVR